MRSGLALIAASAVALAGCAANPVYNLPSPVAGQPPDSASSSTASAQPPGGDSAGAGAELPESPAVSAAAASLVVESRDRRNAGDLNGAAATIERGLTIAPDQALLWIELAEIRLAQGDRSTAEEMARKALTLTNAGTPVAERAERLLRR